MTRPLVIIDSANVVGSVPDGWWRDRAGATERLRDNLATLATDGLPGTGAPEPPWEVVLVVEGRASKVRGTDQVRVVVASGSGDDAIVDLVRTEGAGRPTVVITADRELRHRVSALGATVLGPRTVRR